MNKNYIIYYIIFYIISIIIIEIIAKIKKQESPLRATIHLSLLHIYEFNIVSSILLILIISILPIVISIILYQNIIRNKPLIEQKLSLDIMYGYDFTLSDKTIDLFEMILNKNNVKFKASLKYKLKYAFILSLRNIFVQHVLLLNKIRKKYIDYI